MSKEPASPPSLRRKKLKDHPTLKGSKKNLSLQQKERKVSMQKNNVRKTHQGRPKKMEGTQKIPPKPKVKKNLRFRQKINEHKPEEKFRGK